MYSMLKQPRPAAHDGVHIGLTRCDRALALLRGLDASIVPPFRSLFLSVSGLRSLAFLRHAT